jgi:anaerobic selenocysteine-containing dehydrogenase
MSDPAAETWHPTACILCSRNCGIEVQTAGGRITRTRGDAKHPISAGYLCQKAARLDYYQNASERLDMPLRRRADGTFEPVSWDVAVREIAERLLAIRREHGGRVFAFYGAGGQGNHLGGAYGRGLLAAMGSPFYYSALAQEKTGDFWVNGRLFGHQACHVSEDVEHADLVLFIGTNPWQSHGIRNARDTLRAIAKDPARRMVVIDPRRTETAELADLHLQVRPGTDAFLLAAILAVVVAEGHENQAFLRKHTRGFEDVRAALAAVPVADYAARAGVAETDVRNVARWLGEARSACVRIDLGLQQSLHSTLNSYLEKLLFLLTGHFGRPGTNALHTWFVPLVGHSDPARLARTAVTGFPEIGKMFPPSVLPAEITSDHPQRVRALVVDSANPVLSGADTQAYRAAMAKLELLVVVDVVMTETARHAHYVLPASSQFEKWETTFFTLEFPTQGLHLRRPLFAPRPGTLPESEIYRRILVEMNELPRAGFPQLRRLARWGRRVPRLRLYPLALAALLRRKPRLNRFVSFVLADTMGAALPSGAASAAPLWGAAQMYARKHGAAVRRTGLRGKSAALGDALFERLMRSPSGALLSTHEHSDAFRLVRHKGGRIELCIPELLAELGALANEAPPAADDPYPFVLIAGERRSYNANAILRDPGWRRADADGALHMHPEDAAARGIGEGARALCESARGRIVVRVALTDTLPRGVVTLPHGYGMEVGGRTCGPALNELTAAEHRDPIAGTPLHKHVRVRLRPAS